MSWAINLAVDRSGDGLRDGRGGDGDRNGVKGGKKIQREEMI